MQCCVHARNIMVSSVWLVAHSVDECILAFVTRSLVVNLEFVSASLRLIESSVHTTFSPSGPGQICHPFALPSTVSK